MTSLIFSEYYFSAGKKNIFLEREMDEDGFLSLDLIANFPRAHNLTINQEFIIDCLRDSEMIELSEDQQKVNLGDFHLLFNQIFH